MVEVPPIAAPALADPRSATLDAAIAQRVQQIHALELAVAADLVALLSMDAFRQMGFSGPGHYGEVRGIGAVSRTLALLALGKGLSGLATSRAAFLEGRLTTERAAALCQVALPSDEAQWCERAARANSAQFQQEVRAELVRRGERPPTRRHIMEIEDRDAQAFEQARGQVHRDLGRTVSEGQALGEISRHYVECRDAKRRRMQTTRTLATQAGGEAPEGIPGARYVPSAVARTVWTRDRGCCRVPGCTFVSLIELGHIIERRLGGAPTADNLLLICRAHNVLMEEGMLIIRGSADAPFFHHSDGRLFGAPPTPSTAHGPSP